MRRWTPLAAQTIYGRPKVGDLISHQHAVWRVVRFIDLPLDDEDRERWLQAQMPDLSTWHQRPYRMDVDFVAGERPKAVDGDGPVPGCMMEIRSKYNPTWYVYRNGRWPQCSCCGEPMPCRAEMQDREITAALTRVDKLARRVDGACWACEQPISSRQQSVTYPGENIDFPGGPTVRFHMRRSCLSTALSYERRWVAGDPRRERILTYPDCGGALIVHGDGTTECSTMAGPLGNHYESTGGCRGHLTHDHGLISACYAAASRFAARNAERCDRGCDPAAHPGTRFSPRPLRRDQDTLDGAR